MPLIIYEHLFIIIDRIILNVNTFFTVRNLFHQVPDDLPENRGMMINILNCGLR
jgi:hypothetical protein